MQFYIDAFFAQFPLFPCNPFRPFTEEFHRMCQWFGWTRGQRLLAYDSFQLAIIAQFNGTCGMDVNNLTSWQLLCLVLGINHIPTDLKTCRKVSLQPHLTIARRCQIDEPLEGTRDLCQHLRPVGIPNLRASTDLPHRSCAERVLGQEPQSFP